MTYVLPWTKTAAFLIAVLLARHMDRAGGFQLYNHTENDRRRNGVARGAAPNQNSKIFFKGQKMKVDNGDTATILDFDAQTITTVNNKQKTVTREELQRH